MTYGTEKQNGAATRRLKIFEDMITRFDRIHKCDIQTDRRKPHDSIGHGCIALCDKNRPTFTTVRTKIKLSPLFMVHGVYVNSHARMSMFTHTSA